MAITPNNWHSPQRERERDRQTHTHTHTHTHTQTAHTDITHTHTHTHTAHTHTQTDSTHTHTQYRHRPKTHTHNTANTHTHRQTEGQGHLDALLAAAGGVGRQRGRLGVEVRAAPRAVAFARVDVLVAGVARVGVGLACGFLGALRFVGLGFGLLSLQLGFGCNRGLFLHARCLVKYELLE